MNDKELLSAMALSRLTFGSQVGMLALYREAGSASVICDNSKDLKALSAEVTDRLCQKMADLDAAMEWARGELDYCRKHRIEVLPLMADGYPERLRHCPDAPMVLYYRGTANLNSSRIIDIIGTRRITAYGQDLVRRFVRELHDLCPDTIIVSGLAYGVDIHAHRNALANDMETIGVVAHGLDHIYPAGHRNTAVEMLSRGGLLTEYPTKTIIEKQNFVRRNRIVAGMSDATILIESAVKGGGLITCDIARNYNRDVYAFPGRVGDEYSAGCNRMIRDNVAAMITSAEDFVEAMGWEHTKEIVKARSEGIERQLFPDLSPEEQSIVDELQRSNDLQLNVLAVKTSIPMGKLTSTLFTLEMKGVVKAFAGGVYHLIS